MHRWRFWLSTRQARRSETPNALQTCAATAGDAPGLAVSPCDLLQNLLVQGQVCNRPPQASVLLLEDLQRLA